MNKLSLRLLLLLLATFFYGCSTTEQATTTTIPADTAQTVKPPAPDPVDFSTLLEPPEDWHHYDEKQTRFRGISSNSAHKFLENRTPENEVVVAVIDGGIDTDHEDLKSIMWTNGDEIPGNGEDDDQNGYIDDIHGWNFIGGPDGENVHHDTFELTRIFNRLDGKFSNIDTTQLNQQQHENYSYYKKILSDYRQEVEDLLNQYTNITSLEESMNQARNILTRHFESSSFSYEEVQNLQPQDQQLQFAQNVMLYVFDNDIDSTLLSDQKKQIYEFAKYGYNPEFSPRHIVGDNYEDKTERFYGNNDVAGPDPGHGTHVAGIVAAARDNGIGIDGIAANTRIMAVRAVPNGDERDKDVANAIRYAVDNGADIINMSFGKAYSPYKEVVDEAVKYAQANGVLMVHGAGNDAKNIDQKPSYPSDQYKDGGEADLWLSVGATSWKPGKEFVASFSNYGNQNVDVFAPGVDIYSTMPDNSYEFQNGTSMASPVVAGIAALIKAYYPKLTTKQIRNVIIESSVTYEDQKVILPNQESAEEPLVPFETLSVSDGLVNVYNALQWIEKNAN